MNKPTALLGLLIMISFSLLAQDEGVIVKRERIDHSKGIFLGLGPSFTLGKNIGDYSVGFNIEAGFLKRLNRVLSIGPSLSYLKFDYDPDKTGLNNIFFGEEDISQNGLYYIPGLIVDFHGGNLSLVSAAVNLKLNLIPVKDDSKFSVYGFAKPFITVASRSEVKGDAHIMAILDADDNGEYDDREIEDALDYAAQIPWEAGDDTWEEYGVVISNDLKRDTRVTGGIFIGPGIEIMPAKKVSFYAQVAFGYTFPVSFISTDKYEGNDLNNIDERYPIAEEGFPSINLQFGASFNF